MVYDYKYSMHRKTVEEKPTKILKIQLSFGGVINST